MCNSHTSLTCAKRGTRRRQNRRNIPCKCFFLSLLHKKNGDSEKNNTNFHRINRITNLFLYNPNHHSNGYECRLVKSIDSFTSGQRLSGTSRNERPLNCCNSAVSSFNDFTDVGRTSMRRRKMDVDFRRFGMVEQVPSTSEFWRVAG